MAAGKALGQVWEFGSAQAWVLAAVLASGLRLGQELKQREQVPASAMLLQAQVLQG